MQRSEYTTWTAALYTSLRRDMEAGVRVQGQLRPLLRGALCAKTLQLGNRSKQQMLAALKGVRMHSPDTMKVSSETHAHCVPEAVLKQFKYH